MMCSLATLLACACFVPTQPAAAPTGYLWQPAFAVDTLRRAPASAYQPQPGDIMIANSHNRCWKASYRLALSGPPTHAGIIVRTSGGELALLEAGLGLDLHVELSSVLERMRDYPGDVYIRRRITPLTEAECARLTEFAEVTFKKSVPPARFVLQVTPLRMRGPLRTHWLAKPHGIRHGYICSELVVETIVWAGLIDPATARPAATYPQDLFYDRSTNPFLNRHFRLCDGWHPPALWTMNP